jgi:hypothetical protein
MEQSKHPRLPIGRTNPSSTMRTRFWLGYKAGNRQLASLRFRLGLEMAPWQASHKFHNAGRWVPNDVWSMQLALSLKDKQAETVEPNRKFSVVSDHRQGQCSEVDEKAIRWRAREK